MKSLKIGAVTAFLTVFGGGGALANDGPVAVGTLPQGSLGYAIAAGVGGVGQHRCQHASCRPGWVLCVHSCA